MKFAAFICLLLAFLGHSLGLRDPICGLPPAAHGFDGKICLAYMPLWSYYPEENFCKKFIYGGCGGNANLFETKKQCEAKCKA